MIPMNEAASSASAHIVMDITETENVNQLVASSY